MGMVSPLETTTGTSSTCCWALAAGAQAKAQSTPARYGSNLPKFNNLAPS